MAVRLVRTQIQTDSLRLTASASHCALCYRATYSSLIDLAPCATFHHILIILIEPESLYPRRNCIMHGGCEHRTGSRRVTNSYG
jgi:hypothetical protein